MGGGKFGGEAGSEFFVGDLHHVVALGGGRADYRVAHHSDVPAVAAVAVQFGGQFSVALIVLGAHGARACDHDGVGAAGGERSYCFFFVVRGAGCCGQQDHAVLLAGCLLDATSDGGEVGVGNVVNNKADQSGTGLSQGLSLGIGDVAELFGGLADAFRDVFCWFAGRAVEDPGCRSQGDPGQTGNFTQCAGGHGALLFCKRRDWR